METIPQTITLEEAERLRKKQFEKNKWVFTSSGIGRDMFYQLIGSFLLTYIQFGVSLTLAQFTTLSLIIGVCGRIWDAINDPMMGAIIEGANLKSGKFRPWILLGALTCGLVVILMFNIQSLAGWKFVVFMSIMYLLWESTFTMNDIGYWSLLPSLSSQKDERNSATALTVLFAGIGAIIAQGVIPMVTVGDVRAGYSTVSIVVASVYMISQLICFLFVKEGKRKKNSDAGISIKHMWKTICRNDQVLWMTLSMLFYNIASAMLTALASNVLYMEIGYNGALYFYVVVAYGVTSVVINIIYPMIAAKLGRRKLQLYSIMAALLGYAMIGLMGWTNIFPFTVWALCAFCVLVSSGQSLFYMATIVNMTNCVEYNDYKFHERSEAVVSTLRPFMAKFAAAMHTLLITIVLTLSGTFLLSQSISTLETQMDFFGKISSPAEQAQYIETVNTYAAEFEGLELGSDEYESLAEDISAALEGDSFMGRFQIDARYLPALTDAMVMENRGGELTELGRIKELSADDIDPTAEYTLQVGDLESGKESAANLNFRDKSTFSMRLWVRFAISLLPMILLIFALIIQRKKFIIDEDYYDMMVKEIAEREKAQEA